MKNLKIIFMGTPEFGAIILKGLIDNDFKPDLVITTPDKPVGRKQIITPPPVKVLAQENNIPVMQPVKLKEITEDIKKMNPDLIIEAAYGKLIPKELLDIPKYKTINVHPSLLPKYRGASPIQSVILNGDKKTGVTIMLVEEKLDSGPILSQEEVEIREKETAKELHNKLAILGTDLLIKTIPQWVSGEIKEKEQEETEATYFNIIKKEDGKINWKESADVIERKVRAFDPWPGTFTTWEKDGNTMKIKILKSRVLISPDNTTYPMGKVLVVPQNEIGIQCKENFFVIEELQMEGKKPTKAEDFIRGHKDFIGTILK
ncbi:MAG: methionyl-tRNA formyltransferase [Candidatus Nealsonbacteria bacterium]